MGLQRVGQDLSNLACKQAGIHSVSTWRFLWDKVGNHSNLEFHLELLGGWGDS